jgi:hypothetical protein
LAKYIAYAIGGELGNVAILDLDTFDACILDPAVFASVYTSLGIGGSNWYDAISANPFVSFEQANGNLLLHYGVAKVVVNPTQRGADGCTGLVSHESLIQPGARIQFNEMALMYDGAGYLLVTQYYNTVDIDVARVYSVSPQTYSMTPIWVGTDVTNYPGYAALVALQSQYATQLGFTSPGAGPPWGPSVLPPGPQPYSWTDVNLVLRNSTLVASTPRSTAAVTGIASSLYRPTPEKFAAQFYATATPPAAVGLWRDFRNSVERAV